MAIDNAILGFPHSDRVSKRSLQEHWDRQDAREYLDVDRHSNRAKAAMAFRLAQYPMGAADYVQVRHAIKYLMGERKG